jgi:hypothetical protein
MLPCICFTCLVCSCCCVMFCAAKSQHVRETVNMFTALDLTNLYFCFLSSENPKIMNTEHSLQRSVGALNFDSSTQYDWIQVCMCTSEPLNAILHIMIKCKCTEPSVQQTHSWPKRVWIFGMDSGSLVRFDVFLICEFVNFLHILVVMNVQWRKKEEVDRMRKEIHS